MSDILIRGMEMPKGGYRTVEIGFDADGHPMALADGGDVFDVIPIPPHGRLKDYGQIMKEYDEWFNKTESREYENMFYALRMAINGSPTIIPPSFRQRRMSNDS